MVKQKDQKDRTVDKENEDQHSLHVDDELVRWLKVLDLFPVPNVFKSLVATASNVANKESPKDDRDRPNLIFKRLGEVEFQSLDCIARGDCKSDADDCVYADVKPLRKDLKLQVFRARDKTYIAVPGVVEHDCRFYQEINGHDNDDKCEACESNSEPPSEPVEFLSTFALQLRARNRFHEDDKLKCTTGLWSTDDLNAPLGNKQWRKLDIDLPCRGVTQDRKGNNHGNKCDKGGKVKNQNRVRLLVELLDVLHEVWYHKRQ